MRVILSNFVAALLIMAMAVCAQPAARAAEPITETARKIPVAYDVDVVVVGGSTGAVSAAVAAAEAGAKVFLAAPRPYLGEDVCATMRLWLEEGEKADTPLARALFNPAGRSGEEARLNSVKFAYQADLKAARRHPDPKSSLLNDGEVGLSTEAVQYDGDVTITTDMGSAQALKVASMVLFYRPSDFGAQNVIVRVSEDGKNWKLVREVPCSPENETIFVSAPLGITTRFVQFTVKKGDNQRVLIGEIALEPAGPIKPATDEKLQGPYRPLYVKKALDEALLKAGVKFLYGCYATEMLRDAQGNLSGIVMANRAGRQAVRAKVVIDATDRAWAARLAGAQFASYPAGPQEFKYVVIGGQTMSGEGLSARQVGLGYPMRSFVKIGRNQNMAGPGKAEIIEYTLRLPMADGSFASFARAEQRARDLTWNDGIQFLTDELFQVPPDPMKAMEAAGGSWTGVDQLPLEAFQPQGVSRMYVLGGCAELPREQAARLLRPVNLIAMGTRVGQAAAAQAQAIQIAAKPVVAGSTEGGRDLGEVKEFLSGVRSTHKGLPTVDSPKRTLPVLGEVDVVVIGGGTGGAPAGIGAGRAKARTLVIEYLHGLGGVGTLGLISNYYHGYRDGFTKEVPGTQSWNPFERAEWWRKTVLAAGSELWFGAIGCGALVENGKLKGAIVATPQGRGVVLAKTVIDATGNSDIAGAAGAKTVFVNNSEPAVQGTGLPPIRPGSRYTNTDFTIVDETDMLDIWHVMVYAKDKYNKEFDLGQLIDTRERRRIIGDFYMTLPDIVNGRTYPDTICIARSNFDSHGMTVDPYLLLDPPTHKSFDANVPYRCLLPEGLDGILVTGLSVSAHRDAMPILRMQPDVQNMGYAAGLIAATVARNNQSTRQVDLPPIQKQLAAMAIIPQSALGARDSYPLPAEKIAEAIKNPNDSAAMAVIVTHSRLATPLLRQAYADASSADDKLKYARILSVMRDPSGVETMIGEVDRQPWDKGWNYTGMGQFGSSLSPLDRLMVSMARTGDKRCLAPIFRKMEQLTEQSEFSHFRAVALSLEVLGDRSATEPLTKLLAKPGMRGHGVLDPAQAAKLSGANPNDNTTRMTSIRELMLARALYRCGDPDGLGKQILNDYTHDLRGYLARHAQAVLDEK